MSAEQMLMFPLWYVVFLLSITCHEAAHAWVAYRGGDATAYLGGQVTLNPLPHVQRELWGTVLFPILSYMTLGWMMGWASAPYDPYWEDRYPRRAALMALAGPLANVALATAGFAALKVGLTSGVWTHPESMRFDRLVVSVSEAGPWEGLGRFCSVLLMLNLVLAVFNLFPFPPMDGSAILAGFFEPARRLRDQLRTSPLGSLVGLVVAWYLFRSLFPPVSSWVVGLLYGVG